MFLNELVNRAN